MIFEIEITDPALWAEYQHVAGPVMAASGGQFLAFDPAPRPLEGGWQPPSLSIVAFPSLDAAEIFYNSAAYQALLPLRQRASRGRGVLIQSAPEGAC